MIVPRVYTVVFQAVSISAAQDLFELSPADDKPVALLGLFLGQHEEGEGATADEEWLRWAVIRGHTVSGSGGSAPTPRSVNRSDTGAGFAAEVNNTTIANTGTTHILHADSFNIRAGEKHWWTPETAPQAAQSDTTIVVRLVSAPNDAILFDGTLYVAELG